MNFTLLDGHICMTHINHCFQVLLIAFKSLSRMQPWRTEIFLQVSHLPEHHSFVLPPELKQIQVIKGLIFCGNCPWLKIHSCRKTNCQCREKKLPFVRIKFIPAQISGEVQCCAGSGHGFSCSQKPHMTVKSLPPSPLEISSLYLLALVS